MKLSGNKNPNKILQLACVIYALFFVSALAAGQSSQAKPNVIIILTDDQGWGDLSFHGNPYIKTPAMDALAMEGASFSNFYVSPLCAPTRASMLTGRYHLRTGAVSVSRGLEIMNEEETTLGELFTANGYITGCFGKWHNGSHFPNDPNGQGFQEFFGFCGGHWNNYFNTTYQHNQAFEKADGYIADVLTDKAIKFIKENKAKPFLCYLALNTPHSPHQVPDKYFNKYKSKGLDDELAAIYGMCENIDDNLARVTRTLKDLKLEKNTIVIFLSDNGPNGKRYNGLLRDIKGSPYEGGIKVPCFIRWTGKIKPGLRIDHLSQHIDLYPTLVDLCSLKNNAVFPLDGKSRSDILCGDKTLENRYIFTHVSQPVPSSALNPYSGSVRDLSYSLVLKDNAIELFDLRTDPSQKVNISDKFPGITDTLKRKYLAWFDNCMKNFNADRPIPLDGRQVILPAYESEFSSNLKFKEGHGWVHDWLINFGAANDTISWTIKNTNEQQFTAFVEYAAASVEDGIKVELMINNIVGTSVVIAEKCDPPYITSPDRVPRKEVYERDWCKIKMGEVTLPAGEYKITLIVTSQDQNPLAEFKSLALSKE